MSRLFYHVMQDNAGNLLFDVSGTMRLAGTGTAATIYGDAALTIPIANPMTNHPSFGSFKCYLGAGNYDFYMAKAGYTFETLTGVQGLGTMAQQDASAVAITGGSVQATTLSQGGPPTATFGLTVGGQTLLAGNVAINDGTLPVTENLRVNGTCVINGYTGINTFPAAPWSLRLGAPLLALTDVQIDGTLGLGLAPASNVKLYIVRAKASQFGMIIKPNDSDSGNAEIGFQNFGGGVVGSITSSISSTSYNTTSDARLKHAIAPLTGELEVVQALRPVAFRWKADDTPGVGFLASEVAQHVAGVITGEPDAVDAEGNILPQMIDPSKLVVWLVGACKTLAAKLEASEARLAILEDALGV